MLKTLQWYVSRELLKYFALTAVGLALTFSLTGIVFSMVRADALNPTQMLRLMIFVLPTSLTMTLPVSALFACAMVYGRLASDNEFDACRASGVNIHRLLLPAFGLSVFTALFTFLFANFVLPRSVKSLDELMQKDAQKIVVSALNMRGYFKQGSMIFHASDPPREDRLPDGASGSRVSISGAAFMQVVDDTLLRVGTADQVNVDFWNDPRTGDPIAQPAMFGIRIFDFEQNRLYSSEGQPLDPMVVPLFLTMKVKWLTLPELLKYWDRPTELAPVQKQITKLRAQFREALFYKHAVEQLQTGDRVLRLNDLDGRLKYELRAERIAHDPLDFRPQLDGVRLKHHFDGHVREYHAQRCSIRVGRGLGASPMIVQLHVAGDVTFTDSQDGDRERRKQRDGDLEPVPMPESLVRQERELNDFKLLAIDENMIRDAREGRMSRDQIPPFPYDLGQRVEGARNGTLAQIVEEALQISGIIHSRLAFSTSVLVMLVLAAALAIIFRGGQVLTAFVISFIPGLVVSVMNTAGRQLAERPETHLIGLVVIWAGIGVVALADVVVLGKFLRR